MQTKGASALVNIDQPRAFRDAHNTVDLNMDLPFDSFLYVVQLAFLHLACMPDIILPKDQHWYQMST